MTTTIGVSAICSGRWQNQTIRNAPTSVESFLLAQQRPSSGGVGGGWQMTASDVRHLFALHPTTLCLDRCRFVGGDATQGAFLALTEEVARSPVLVCLSLAGCLDVSPASRMALWNALLENTSIESICVSDLGLTTDDAAFIAQNVLPWNRCIVEWNLKGNSALGDEGARGIVDALVSGASSVQRLNLSACGMHQSTLRDVLLQLRTLTSLVQLDVSRNEGYHNPVVLEVMRDVDEVLHRNTKLMHPGGTVIEHTSLYAPSDADSSSQLPPAQNDDAQREPDAPSPSSALGSSARRSSLVHKDGIASNPAVSRRLSLRRASMADSDPSEKNTLVASMRGKTPPPLSSSLQRRRSNVGPSAHQAESTPQRSVRRQSSVHQDASARRASRDDVAPHRAEVPPNQHAPPNEAFRSGGGDVSSIVDVSAISSVEGGAAGGAADGAGVPSAAMPPFGATPSPRRGSNLSATSDTPTGIRRAVAAVSARQPSASRRASATPSSVHTAPPVAIAPVTEGMEEWRRIKEQYNSYIRAGTTDSPQRRHSATESPQRRAALETPKYVLGKLVSKERNSPSSAFRPRVDNVMYVREPMPAERRKYAPWVQQQGGVDASSPPPSTSRRSSTPTQVTPRRQSYVGNRVIIMDEHSDPLHRTAIRIVDGGDITMIANDPREIGYVSRRLQSGDMVVRSSAAFSSNTSREVRWGTDPTNQLARSAQAPPPGSYDIPSSFDQTVRKAQGAARGVSATGKRVFGSTASERSIYANNNNGVPGPGFYEIP